MFVNFEKSLPHAEVNGPGYIETGPVIGQNKVLPNPVRLSTTRNDPNLCLDYRNYIENEGQRKPSARNKLEYAKWYCRILETKEECVLMNLSQGSKVYTRKHQALLSKFLGKYDKWVGNIKKYRLRRSKPGTYVNVFKSIMDSRYQRKWFGINDWVDKRCILRPTTRKQEHLAISQTYRIPARWGTKFTLVNKDIQKRILFRPREKIVKSLLLFYFLRTNQECLFEHNKWTVLEITRITQFREHYYNFLRISIKNRMIWKCTTIARFLLSTLDV